MGKHVVAEQALCYYRYTGEKLVDTKLEKLLEATWQPAPAGAYPDLPQSPRAQASTSGKAPTSAAPPQKQGADTGVEECLPHFLPEKEFLSFPSALCV